MATLEQITAGSLIKGITGSELVTVVAVNWHGSSAITVTYRQANGSLHERLLYREDEVNLEIAEPTTHWSFDGDANMLRLMSEAYRIHLAHLFDPYLAVHTSEIEPLPHQISAVYQEMLPRLPCVTSSPMTPVLVKVSLEVEASSMLGFSATTVPTVSENSRALRVDDFGFED